MLAKASFAFVLPVAAALAQQGRPPQLPPGPMLDEGTVALQSPDLKDLNLTLVRSSQTVASLKATAAPNMDYTPGDRLKERSADSFYHLGDLDLRLRSEDERDWKDFSTAHERQPVRVLSAEGGKFSADLAATLPADIPLTVTRTWSVQNGELSLSFLLTNRTDKPVHIGGLGIPLVFNNIMNGKKLDQAYAECSFYDPYIGEDAGYVQVVHLNGLGPVLLVVPEGHTPFEAYKPILDRRDRTTGKGCCSMIRRRAAQRSKAPTTGWFTRSALPRPTGRAWRSGTQLPEAVLQPGKSLTYGLRFLVAPSIRQIEATLTAHHRPVAFGVPGYILPTDMQGHLFLRYDRSVKSIVSEPADALSIKDDGHRPGLWHAYTLHAERWGRSRVVITYSDGTVQSHRLSQHQA